MEELIVGQTYKNGKLLRKITKIDGYEIYYKTEKGTEKNCWLTTFQDWVRKGEKSEETETCKYEIVYTKNGNEYITTDDLTSIDKARIKAKELKELTDVTTVKIMEIKTITKIIEF